MFSSCLFLAVPSGIGPPSGGFSFPMPCLDCPPLPGTAVRHGTLPVCTSVARAMMLNFSSTDVILTTRGTFPELDDQACAVWVDGGRQCAPATVVFCCAVYSGGFFTGDAASRPRGVVRLCCLCFAFLFVSISSLLAACATCFPCVPPFNTFTSGWLCVPPLTVSTCTLLCLLPVYCA